MPDSSALLQFIFEESHRQLAQNIALFILLVIAAKSSLSFLRVLFGEHYNTILMNAGVYLIQKTKSAWLNLKQDNSKMFEASFLNSLWAKKIAIWFCIIVSVFQCAVFSSLITPLWLVFAIVLLFQGAGFLNVLFALGLFVLCGWLALHFWWDAKKMSQKLPLTTATSK